MKKILCGNDMDRMPDFAFRMMSAMFRVQDWLRPSGNADELRIYAVADTEERADAIAAMGVAEPDGILRRMERAVSHSA